MSVGVVPHAGWLGTSKKIMPACPLPPSNRYFTGRVQMGEGWLQVGCYLYRGAITSDMSADPVALSHMPACTVQLCQTCSDTCICSASPSGRPTG